MRVEIGGSLKEAIQNDAHSIINGHLTLQSKEEMNIISQSQINLNANNNILLTSKYSISMDMQEYLITQAKNAIMQALESIEIQSKICSIHSQDEVQLQVGETSISISGNTITIKHSNNNSITLDDNGIQIQSKKVSISKG